MFFSSLLLSVASASSPLSRLQGGVGMGEAGRECSAFDEHTCAAAGASMVDATALLDSSPDARAAATRAQAATLVTPQIGNFSSYAGYFTTNATTDNHMFWWHFPAQNGDVNAPLVIWLQGGPGGSSLFGLFTEMGPLSCAADLSVHAKPFTWNAKYAMLFIDNPVGAGFSYTTTDEGYATNEDDVRQLASVSICYFAVL